MATYNLATLLGQFNKDDLIQKRVESEDVVFHEGAKTTHVYFVIAGEVRLERYLTNGRNLVFFRAMGGAALSEVGLFLDRHPYTAVATVESQLVMVRKELMVELIRRDWKVMERFFFCMASRYMEALISRELSGIRSADERLRMWFEWQVSMGEREFHLEGRMGTLGEDLGLARESVYRSLARLEKLKFIERDNGIIRVVGS